MMLACPECGPSAEVVTNIDAKPAARDLNFQCGECGREPVVHSHVEGGVRP
jgi:transcription elongation factor Elf1